MVSVRARGLLPVFAVAALMLSGCGVPAVGSGEQSSSPSKLPSGAPHVTNPLHYKEFVKNPCSTLTSAQVQELSSSFGIGKQTRTGNVVGASCTWLGPGTTAQVDISFPMGKYGLSSLYVNGKLDPGEARPEPPIGGYPTVQNLAFDDGGSCGIDVGISDKQVVDVSYAPNNMSVPDKCGAARKIAAAAIKTIKAAG